MAELKLAIVVPVLNEALTLPEALVGLGPLRAAGVVVIVVDGGSNDDTVAVATRGADAVLAAPRGRAAQMNAGACHPLARAADVLLFLHADTRLPPNAHQLVAKALSGGALWGRFDVRIVGRHPLLPMVAAFMNWRSRKTRIATGDQAMFVCRRVWGSLGGFAAIPLMEDIELSERLRVVSAPASIAQPVHTAGRRWDQRGFWRTVLLMWRLRAAYALGRNPTTLAQRYGYAPRAPAAVAIMAKAPVPGLAKTRLTPLLGDAGAARAQRGFILRILATARQASTGLVTLHCTPPVHRLFHLLTTRWGVVCVGQVDGDIGCRMGAVMVQHFAKRFAPPLLIVGTDCPVLTPAILQSCADALLDHDAVLIPAEDGGYVLIGFRKSLPQVFSSVDWSTPRVMGQTRERLKAQGDSWRELPALWDVDDPGDWARWQTLKAHQVGGTPAL
jgi:rSAM/selenodomain-associated transferase 2/rSAM/selenodomain-associated transferase 1